VRATGFLPLNLARATGFLPLNLARATGFLPLNLVRATGFLPLSLARDGFLALKDLTFEVILLSTVFAFAKVFLERTGFLVREANLVREDFKSLRGIINSSFLVIYINPQ